MPDTIKDSPLPLCGACQAWGADPDLYDDISTGSGRCRTCKRTSDEIREAHGILYVRELTPGITTCRA